LDARTLRKKKKLSVGSVGPRGLHSDINQNLVYVPGCGNFRDHDYQGFVLLINGLSHEVMKLVELPIEPTPTSPNNKQ
jgi:hypothetical protein